LPHAQAGHAAWFAAGNTLVIFFFFGFCLILSYFHRLTRLFSTLQRFPPFFPEALPRRRTPFDTGRCLLFIDVSPAFFALNAELIGEHLNHSAAAGAFIKSCFQIARILPGTFTIHRFIIA
jgi:hypothetical protein